MRDGHNDTLARIGEHFVQKGLLILGVWIFKRVFSSRRSISKQTDKSSTNGRSTRRPPAYKLYLNPLKEFKAVNPAWLKNLVERVERGEVGHEQPPFPPGLTLESLGTNGSLVQGGAQARRELFLLEDGVIYLNHGSYGATFRVAMEAQAWYRLRLEAQPVRFMEDEALPAVLAALQAVAQLVGARFRDLVAVTNATSAINLVVQSLHLRKGDLLLMTNLTYPAVKHTLARAAGAAGAGLIEVQLNAEVLCADTAEPLIALFQEAVAKGRGRLRLAVIDHIASNPPYHFPVERLAALCRAAGAQVLLDGAHAVGAVPLSVDTLGADYYTSNLHKWACSPKGAAFLWVHPAHHASLKPLVTSHGYGLGFWGEMLWAGTSDATAMMAVPVSLAVLHKLGLEHVRQYNHSLLTDAVALLTSAWGTSTVIGASAQWACMASVQLPRLGPSFPVSVDSALRLHDRLRQDFNIEVPCSCYGGHLWVRISAQYYNRLPDYQALADAILALAT